MTGAVLAGCINIIVLDAGEGKLIVIVVDVVAVVVPALAYLDDESRNCPVIQCCRSTIEKVVDTPPVFFFLTYPPLMSTERRSS